MGAQDGLEQPSGTWYREEGEEDVAARERRQEEVQRGGGGEVHFEAAEGAEVLKREEKISRQRERKKLFIAFR